MSDDLQTHMKSICDSGKFSDAMLVARSKDDQVKEFPSHMVALSRSKVFLRMLTGSFAESESRRAEIPVVQFKHFEVFQKFLYSNCMEFADDCTADDVLEVWILSDKYEVDSAASVAYESLTAHLRHLSLEEVQKMVDRACDTAMGHKEPLIRPLVGIATKSLKADRGFGNGLVHALSWLRRVQQHTGFCMRAEAMDCLTTVTRARPHFEKEMQADGDGPPEFQMIKMLVSAKYSHIVSKQHQLNATFDLLDSGFVNVALGLSSASATAVQLGLSGLFPDQMSPDVVGVEAKPSVVKKQRTE